MTWHTDSPPRQGEYLAVDGWGQRTVAVWRSDLGWCVRGRWLGHDGVLGWMDLPEVPVNVMRERW